jgi:hypothetical protein
MDLGGRRSSAEIIDLSSRAERRTRSLAPVGEAAVLLFTGVRYERLEPASAATPLPSLVEPDEPRRRRR